MAYLKAMLHNGANEKGEESLQKCLREDREGESSAPYRDISVSETLPPVFEIQPKHLGSLIAIQCKNVIYITSIQIH